jgi:DNA polymerase-3 subunit delta'
MSFFDFHGNTAVVTQLRGMLARDRFPHAVILSGPQGAGKYTLAQMLAKTMNCQEQPVAADGLPDFCGRCSNCTRIAQADELSSRFAEAVETREGMREADKKDTRIFVQTHPEVLVIPPDPPQMLIKVGQIRHVIETIYYRPADARRKVYIFTESAFMKEAANSLLKILEEPPDFATIFLLARNPGELLPTIRSRCVTFTLAPLPKAEIQEHLAKIHPDWNARQCALVAGLSGGAIGRAQTFDLKSYSAARQDALLLLSTAVNPDDHTALFRVTEAYRAGAEGKEKTDALLRAMYSLLEDLLFLKSNAPELVRNTDISAELTRLVSQVSFDWLTRASQALGQVESGMRRNLLRNVSLDAFVAAIEG